jgi:hypothetical protein
VQRHHPTGKVDVPAATAAARGDRSPECILQAVARQRRINAGLRHRAGEIPRVDRRSAELVTDVARSAGHAGSIVVVVAVPTADVPEASARAALTIPLAPLAVAAAPPGLGGGCDEHRPKDAP